MIILGIESTAHTYGVGIIKTAQKATQKETKNILEKQINDPYKESVE